MRVGSGLPSAEVGPQACRAGARRVLYFFLFPCRSMHAIAVQYVSVQGASSVTDEHCAAGTILSSTHTFSPVKLYCCSTGGAGFHMN